MASYFECRINKNALFQTDSLEIFPTGHIPEDVVLFCMVVVCWHVVCLKLISSMVIME